jgi:hypothetical protein
MVSKVGKICKFIDNKLHNYTICDFDALKKVPPPPNFMR